VAIPRFSLATLSTYLVDIADITIGGACRQEVRDVGFAVVDGV
jgi:hypothetical protein